MKPIRYENDLPVFTTFQLEEYGLPEHWGYEHYEVIENRDTVTMTTDYKLEQQYFKRPIHRYCRKQRFKTTLGQLCGDTGKVPLMWVAIVGTYLKTDQPDLWNQARKILKHYKQRLYYNRIPFILQQITKTNSSKKIHADQYRAIMADFERFCFLYEQHKHFMNRKYFPNMRFIALKLLAHHGVTFNYEIPVARNKQKRKELEEIWDWFMEQ